MTDTLLIAAILIPCLVVAIVFHEVAHGWTALALGDPTAKEQRRLSLNPIRHIDPIGTLLVPGALALTGGPIFGWAKPVPVRKDRLDNPRYGMMAVAAAGPGTNILLGFLGAIAFGLYVGLAGVNETAITVFSYFVLINAFLALFNLLPIPPFDGSHILEGLLPRSMAAQYAKFQKAGILVFVALVIVVWAFPEWRILERTIGPPLDWVLGQFREVALFIAQLVAG
ncbi:peptidase M50 [Blastomonas marina]|uniref:Peptidase M50 n=1 Tax=Blastomonas marina TaxID=1867408 RepID=A0ABQ1FDT8_9SPHN|nr:site-2 protease family protein [Blastomonas marina]GGA07255.1 peptidase M50 [Blastomonas marina]